MLTLQLNFYTHKDSRQVYAVLPCWNSCSLILICTTSRHVEVTQRWQVRLWYSRQSKTLDLLHRKAPWNGLGGNGIPPSGRIDRWLKDAYSAPTKPDRLSSGDMASSAMVDQNDLIFEEPMQTASQELPDSLNNCGDIQTEQVGPSFKNFCSMRTCS